MGRKTYTHILISEDVDTVLIGAVTLETLGFEVDPVTEELREAKTYLL
jgi:predicted aspartyl protease